MIKSNEYILVEWPKCQDYMEEDWFENEAYYGHASSYFIPKKRIASILDQYNYTLNYITTLINELKTKNGVIILDDKLHQYFPSTNGTHILIDKNQLELRLIKLSEILSDEINRRLNNMEIK